MKIDWEKIKSIGIVISIILSVFSVAQSYSANKISKQSLTVVQRPHLAVKPTKFKEIDKYIYAKKIDGGIELKVQFEITNTGNSTAKNIKTSDVYFSTYVKLSPNKKPTLVNEVKCEAPGSPTLVPGESVFIEIGGAFLTNDEKIIKETLNKITKNELSWPFSVEFYYNYEINAKRGKTALSLLMWPNKVITNYSEEE